MIIRVKAEEVDKLILPVSLMMEKEYKRKDKDFNNSVGNYYENTVRKNLKV